MNSGKFLQFSLCALMFLAISTVTFARAGGGHNYGGGGGYSGSSGSSGSSSSSWSSRSSSSSSGGGGEISPVALIFYGFIAIAGLLVILAVERKTKIEYDLIDEIEEEEQKWVRRLSATIDTQVLNDIKKSDPKFDDIRLARRIEQFFIRVQEAWSQGSLKPVKQMVSDGIYERFKVAIALNRQQGFINSLHDIRIHSVVIVDLRERRDFDVATFAIDASGIDQDTDISSMRTVRKSQDRFTEYWSFVRKKGASTPQGLGLMEACCPSCGQTATTTDVNRCSSCGVLSLAGNHDWILAEITQENLPYRPSDHDDAALKELYKRDPAFNLQSIEDIASAIFWRIRAMECFKDPQLIANIATNTPANSDQFYRDIGVGSVHFVSCQSVKHKDAMFDYIEIEVNWQGTVLSHSGDFRQKHAAITSHLSLKRSAKALTPSGQGLKALLCHSCKAPISNQYQATCKFCTSSLADENVTWVLDSWRDEDDEKYRAA